MNRDPVAVSRFVKVLKDDARAIFTAADKRLGQY
jgi:hypothetical protein